MKSVLISIKPEWCMKILSGEKTIEIRKTRPKLEPPFKCYIYCTKAPQKLITIFRDGDVFGDGAVYHGKPQFVTWDGGNIPSEIRPKEQTVVAEFTCDKIGFYSGKSWLVKEDIENVTAGSCMTLEQVKEYAGWRKVKTFTERKDLYMWHISDLKVYDTPVELSRLTALRQTKFGYEPIEIKRAPQSWCYVMKNEVD